MSRKLMKCVKRVYVTLSTSQMWFGTIPSLADPRARGLASKIREIQHHNHAALCDKR